MDTEKSSNTAAYVGIFTAVAASLCCITPILALLAGTSGIASTLSWLEPFRPYLLGLTILVLAFAWFQKLRPNSQTEMECACENDKPKFIQSKTFLFLVTILAGFMLIFPNYSHLFYADSSIKKQVVYLPESDVGELNYSIQGMTCAGCEAHIEHEVNQLEGILEVDANYETSSALVKYDKGKVTPDEIATAIGKTGYQIIE